MKLKCFQVRYVVEILRTCFRPPVAVMAPSCPTLLPEVVNPDDLRPCLLTFVEMTRRLPVSGPGCGWDVRFPPPACPAPRPPMGVVAFPELSRQRAPGGVEGAIHERIGAKWQRTWMVWYLC